MMGIPENHMREMGSSLQFEPISPAFAERYYCSLQLLRIKQPVFRTLAAPHYSTDLGVRHFREAREFYLHHCQIANIAPLDSGALTAQYRDAPTDGLDSILDGILLFFGDYKAVSQIIDERLPLSKLEDWSYSLLIQSGTLLAASNDPQCINLFVAAAKKAQSAIENYFAFHRAATFETKRTKNNSAALEYLDLGLQATKDAPATMHYMALALRYNLEALLHLSSQNSKSLSDLDKAEEAINAALESAPSNPNKELTSQIIRYSNQISINKAQLFMRSEAYNKADELLKHQLCRAKHYHSEYNAELYGSLSYNSYLTGQHEDALVYARKAFHLYHMIGAVSPLRSIRKITAASLDSLGNSAAASRLVALIDADPVGLEGIYG
ncbi:MAG: hypothetical protein Q4B10_00990 [Actinomycetaceae bacterium]|nr:hypothetical protein [Actinomycetaceae bacterium]